MILAGDIGGTKCNLSLFAQEEEEPSIALRLLFQSRYPTRDFPNFEQLVAAFCQEAIRQHAIAPNDKISAAGLGIPGAIVDGKLQATNLPWTVDAVRLADSLNLHKEDIALMNDLVATACGIDKLPEHDFLPLNHIPAHPTGNKALLAAGTGLGEAMLFWDGSRYLASPSEGGAADFAPRNLRETELLHFICQRQHRVSCEEIFSGRGFRTIHEFLDPRVRHASFDLAPGDSAQEITQHAIAGTCPVCIQTLDVWIDLFGAEAGNVALRVLAYGGVYLAGGIVLKILPKLTNGPFMRSFADKAPLDSVLARVPVFVILNENAPLFGAAYEALALKRRPQKQASTLFHFTPSA